MGGWIKKQNKNKGERNYNCRNKEKAKRKYYKHKKNAKEELKILKMEKENVKSRSKIYCSV
jgi:hypothetical protein